MNQVDRARVRAAFSRGAAAYDGRAEVQALVRARALALAGQAAPRATRILDVGCGTGRLLADLAGSAGPGAAAWRSARLAGVDLARGMCAAARAAAPGAAIAAADAEALPFRDGAFDLLLSTSAFQWLGHLGPALGQCARVLAPGGALVLSLFAERTLRELKGAWRAAAGPDRPDRTHRFFTAAEVGEALRAAGFRGVTLHEEEHVERHPDARAVLRALKAIGAQNAAPEARGLAGRRTTLELLRRYDAEHGGPSGVPVTWHVVYAVGSR